MKKIILFIILALPATGIYAFTMMIGIEGNYGTFFMSAASSNTTVGSVTTSSYSETMLAEANVKLFFDAHYFRLDVGYISCIFPVGSYTISNNIKTVFGGIVAQGFNWTYLSLGVMAKLPIELSRRANIWFGIGLEYDINLTMDFNSDGTNDNLYGANKTKNKGDFNDLLGVVAMGFTVDVSENFAIVPSVKFKYDFTPFPYTDAYLADAVDGPGYTASQIELYKKNNMYTILSYEIGVGLAIKL